MNKRLTDTARNPAPRLCVSRLRYRRMSKSVDCNHYRDSQVAIRVPRATINNWLAHLEKLSIDGRLNERRRVFCYRA